MSVVIASIRQMMTSKANPTGSPIRDICVVQHAGGSLVICAEKWGGVGAWSPSTGEWTAPPLAFVHKDEPNFADYPDAHNEIDSVAALSVDGKLVLAAGGDEQEPALWDFETGELIARTDDTGAYTAAVIALDDRFVTAQQYSDEIKLWSPDGTDTLLQEDMVSCLAYAEVGRKLILAGGSGVTVWDATTLSELGDFLLYDEGAWCLAACLLDQDPVVFAVTKEGTLHAWSLTTEDLEEAEEAEEAEEPLYGPVPLDEGAVDSLAVVHLGGRPLLVTPAENSLRLRNAADGTVVGHIDTPDHSVCTMRAAAVDDRPVLVTGDYDGVLRIWDEADLAQAMRPA